MNASPKTSSTWALFPELVTLEPVSETTDGHVGLLDVGDSASLVVDGPTKEAEGYETASEGDGDCQFPSSPAANDSYEDALTDEQLKERALGQANDAKAEGNTLFSAGHYDDALAQYSHALELASDVPLFNEIRSICHANRAVCFLKLGRYKDAVSESTKALEFNPVYLKALHRRADTNEKLENFEDAISDMKKVLEIESSNELARRSIQRLEPLAAEKREKMKEEMMVAG